MPGTFFICTCHAAAITDIAVIPGLCPNAVEKRLKRDQEMVIFREQITKVNL